MVNSLLTVILNVLIIYKGDVEWATIQKIVGQKTRVAGYLIKNVFYPVFLDKDHLFYPSTKRHT